jgi:hypothetical protein
MFDCFFENLSKIQVSLEYDKNYGAVHAADRYIYFFDHIAQFFLEWEMLRTKVVEKIKIILCSVTFSKKSCILWENVEKYFMAGKATDENMVHAHCMLDDSLRLCNSYCFSTAKWWHENAAMLRLCTARV